MAQEPHTQDLPQHGAGFLARGGWTGSVPRVTRSPCPGRTVWDACAAMCHGALWAVGLHPQCQLGSHWAAPSCVLKGGKKRADRAGTGLRWNRNNSLWLSESVPLFREFDSEMSISEPQREKAYFNFGSNSGSRSRRLGREGK